MAKKKHHKHRSYAQILNPIHHLERTIELLDRDNDRLQQRVLLLSILSVLLAIAGILFAVISSR
ncbi:hypothetical protein H0V99_02205 [Candidatus Saccharibacteria bacterium]|nr:hypothetical protein [Candidatus Saccharibacteria bacterium]